MKNAAYDVICKILFVQIRPILSDNEHIQNELFEFNVVLGVIYLFCSMIQSIITGLIFLAALLYLGRLVFNSFRAKTGCSSGCGKCGVVDFKKIEKQIQQKSI